MVFLCSQSTTSGSLYHDFIRQEQNLTGLCKVLAILLQDASSESIKVWHAAELLMICVVNE